jgi:hypothetical protein
MPEQERSALARWETWLGHPPREPLPPLRLILIWDNLAGHLSWSIVRWLFQHGVMQRIIARRALAGQHPQSPQEIIEWLEDTLDGWNRAPTPFLWDGKRRERRRRARQ